MYSSNNNRTRRASNRRTLRPPKIITPPFHYTKSQERRAWTCAIYPHAEIFLRLPGAIPWNTWMYGSVRNGRFEYKRQYYAKFNAIPYYALGGTVEEIYNRLYKRDIPANEDLHVRTDPTGDLDIRICPLNVHGESGLVVDTYYTQRYYGSERARPFLLPYFEDCVNWLVDRVVEYFKPHEETLNRMFPFALPFIKDYDIQCRNARRIERVGPLTIIYTTYLQDAGSGYWTPLTKVQVKLTIPMPDIIARAATNGRSIYEFKKDVVIQDHMVEMGFWENPNSIYGGCQYESFLYRPYNLRVRDLAGEVYGCYSGLKQRLLTIYEPEYIHKGMNYLYRLRFLLEVLYANYEKHNKKIKSIRNINNIAGIFNNSVRKYNAGVSYDTIRKVAEIVQNLLRMIYTTTKGERQNTLWFAYYEIANRIREPIDKFIDMNEIKGRMLEYKHLTVPYISAEERDAIIERYKDELLPLSPANRETRFTDYVVSYILSITAARYLHPTPIECGEVIPSELPLVEEERRRRSAALTPPKGPSLADISALPELERDLLKEERRRQPLYRPHMVTATAVANAGS